MKKGVTVLSIAVAVMAVMAATVVFAQTTTGAPEPWQMGLQAAGSPVKAAMDSFHNLLLVIITAITIFVFILLAYVIIRFNAKANPTPSNFSHNTLVEVVWTVVPVIILIVIAVPSFRLLYLADRVENAELTLKVTGRQWYWDYEYPDQGLSFSSIMIPDAEIKPGQRRLLEVDNRIVLPVDTNVRIHTTAGDVLHSWAVPALGVKLDAVPGRLNETWVKITKPGVYFGQCSELCGINHAFMPIAIEAVAKAEFEGWTRQKKAELGQDGSPRAVAEAAASR